MRCPSHQPRLVEPEQPILIRNFGLLRIRSDNLQVPPLAQRKQRIARSTTGMHSAKRCMHPRALLDERNPAIQIAAPQQNMIQQCWHLVSRYESVVVAGL